MGECIEPVEDHHQTVMKSSICLEIVGLPGSGKTTLALELRNRNDQFHLKSPPDWKQLRSLPFYFKNSLSLVPVWASLAFGRHGRWLSVREFLFMIFLNGWHRKLTRLGPECSVIILDQGPVYMLHWMIFFREGQMINSLFKKWWNRTLENWRPVLEGIIWLDSSDSILAERINTREQDHIIKGASCSQIRDFLGRHRVILDKAITMLRAGRQTPEVISYDTGRQSLNGIVDSMMRKLKEIKSLVRGPFFEILS